MTIENDASKQVPPQNPPTTLPEDPAVTGDPLGIDGGNFSNGSWVRQVYVDKQGNKRIATSFIPDDPKEAAEREVEDFNPGNKSTWRQLLGDPENIDIDEGIAILRLDEDAKSATTTWLSNAEGSEIVRHTLTQDSENGGPIASLSQFRECYNANSGLSHVSRFRRCMHHLHS